MGEKFEYSIDDLKMLHDALEDFAGRLKAFGVSDEGIFDSRLVASELAGNVIRHANDHAEIRCFIGGDVIRLEITGEHPVEKASLPTDIFSEHGRGLFLVQAVCEECSVTEHGVSVVVRFAKVKNS